MKVDKKKLVEILLNLDMELYIFLEQIGLEKRDADAIMDIVREHEKAIISLAGAEEELYELLFSYLDEPKEEVVEAIKESCKTSLKQILELGGSYQSNVGDGFGEEETDN